MEEVPLLVLFLILSGFFSGMEIAIFSLTPEKLQALKKSRKNKKILSKINDLEKLKKDVNRLLVTILIGNNIVNVAASSMATVLALNIANDLQINGSTSKIIGIVTGVMTFLILVFGEIMPKTLAYKHALKFSLFAAPIIKFLQIILFPIIYPITNITKKFTGERTGKTSLSEDELKAAIELSAKEGQIDLNERNLVEKILEFNDHSVESVMTPRSKIFSLSDNTPIPEALKKILDENFSRIPVYHDDLDEIIGVLKINLFLSCLQKKHNIEQNVANLSLNSPMKIPKTMKINTLLRDFQKEKQHMAFVYDEHGGLIGLITVEDIIEEVFGEFEDEDDESTDYIRQTGKKSFLISANTELERIEEFVREKIKLSEDFEFPWKTEDENNTISYFILEDLEHFPEIGEEVIIKDEETGKEKLVFTVKSMDEETIKSVILDLKN